MSIEALTAPIGSEWVARLGAAIRPEFRAEVLVPAVADPILGSPPCTVPGACVRAATPGFARPIWAGGERRVAWTGMRGRRPLIQR